MNSGVIVQLILGGFGISGIIGAGVALFRLRPDVNSAAVIDAQNTLKGMRELNDELKEDRDQWKARALEAEDRLRALQA